MSTSPVDEIISTAYIKSHLSNEDYIDAIKTCHREVEQECEGKELIIHSYNKAMLVLEERKEKALDEVELQFLDEGIRKIRRAIKDTISDHLKLAKKLQHLETYVEILER